MHGHDSETRITRLTSIEEKADGGAAEEVREELAKLLMPDFLYAGNIDGTGAPYAAPAEPLHRPERERDDERSE